MFGFKKKKSKNEDVLSQMDGRELKYVTRRVRDEQGNVEELILGKAGRILAKNGEIRVMCGVTDVFRCMEKDAEYYLLMSGNGVTVSGVDTISGEQMDITAYYSYYRK